MRLQIRKLALFNNAAYHLIRIASDRPKAFYRVLATRHTGTHYWTARTIRGRRF
jgi:hypothetical protein